MLLVHLLLFCSLVFFSDLRWDSTRISVPETIVTPIATSQCYYFTPHSPLHNTSVPVQRHPFFASALCSSNHLQRFSSFLKTNRCSSVYPSLFWIFTSALCSTKNLMRFSSPPMTYLCNNLYPSLSGIFTSALCSTNNLTRFSFPNLTVKSSGVSPRLFWLFTSAWRSRNNLTRFLSPRKTDSCSIVYPLLLKTESLDNAILAFWLA